MSKNEDDLEFERKAYVEQIDRDSLISLILQHPALFRKIYHERTVNSLFYDTIQYTDYQEKINGLKTRRKTRIRWYGSLFGWVKEPVLEIKNKENGLRWKIRCPIHPFFIDIHGNTAIQIQYKKQDDLSRTQILMINRVPSSLISYRRIYFKSANRRFRLTVDDQLRFYSPLQNGQGWMINQANPSGTIVELKYSRDDDDDAREITSWYPFRWGSFSKYTQSLD